MLKLLGNEIYRAGDKIGWLERNHVFARDGRKLGYFDSVRVYSADGDKIAYVEGDTLYDAAGNPKAPLELVSEAIEGVLGAVGKCAVFVLLGS
jgi:hypothetical protein